MAFWRYTEAAPDLSGYATTDSVNILSNNLSTVQLGADATAAQLQAYIANQNAGNSGGIAVTIPMTGTGLIPLDSRLVQDARDGMRLNNDTCVVNYPFAANQAFPFTARLANPLTTDDQSSVQTFQGLVPGNAGAAVIARCNAGFTDMVIAIAIQGQVQLLSIVGGTQTTWKTQSCSTPGAGTLELQCVGTNYTILYNGVTVLTYTDVLNSQPRDSLHRYTGYRMYVYNGLFFGTPSPPVTSFNTSDITVPATLGTGWEIFRGTGTATANQPSGVNQIQVSCYDTVKRAANITFINQVVGYIGITKPGWYDVTIRTHLNGAANTSIYSTILYSNLTTAGVPNGAVYRPDKSGQDVTGTQVSNSYGSFNIYCPTGTILSPGINLGPGARGIVGDTNGTLTYFSGNLTSK